MEPRFPIVWSPSTGSDDTLQGSMKFVKPVFFAIVLLNLLGLPLALYFDSELAWLFLPTVPIVVVGLYDVLQTHNTILRNFPILGHFRYFAESIAPEIQQYFIERHVDGTPISRNHRQLVNGRAEGESPTHPFGTELDIYSEHYSGIAHSIFPVEPLEEPPRVLIGNSQCTQPYSASLLNISAMSYGSLGPTAIRALSHGARQGGFYLNTGEGSLTEHHLSGGCDITWQIGTGYFGCRHKDGSFNSDAFAEKANKSEVKMIELKLSQGAKPGHGGVLPAAKNTKEIAEIRMIEPGTVVLSPPAHKEFHDTEGLLRFIKLLRNLSSGKPVGFKLCLGQKKEFTQLCEEMKRLDIYPDFITVDGAEGGTGAAPLEYTDAVGVPMRPALVFVHQELTRLGIRDKIRVIASGKIVNAFDLLRTLSLGADCCNAARAFMLSLGCIQALRCDTNSCPSGVATLDPRLTKGLVVKQKKDRVEKFHQKTVEAMLDLSAACGVANPHEIPTELLLNGAAWARYADVTPG